MPWIAKDAGRHSKAVGKSKKESSAWAKIANSVLKSGKSEGAAVRIANAKAKGCCK